MGPRKGSKTRMADHVLPPDPSAPTRRRLAGLGLLAVVILGVGYIGLRFLGSQVLEVLRGTIEFGTGGSGCIVTAPATSFSSGNSIYYAAYLSREVAAGEVVNQRVLQDGTEVAAVPRTFDVAGVCIGGSIPANALTPAHYRVEFAAGTETLAVGEFDFGPPASSGPSAPP